MKIKIMAYKYHFCSPQIYLDELKKNRKMNFRVKIDLIISQYMLSFPRASDNARAPGWQVDDPWASRLDELMSEWRSPSAFYRAEMRMDPRCITGKRKGVGGTKTGICIYKVLREIH